MTLEPLPGQDARVFTDEGYALLVRRRLTRTSGAEDSNDDGYHVLVVSDRRPWAQALFVPAVADPQWGISRDGPAAGAPNPRYDVAVDRSSRIYAGPWWEGFAMNEPGGYTRYGPWLDPIPQEPGRFDSFQQDNSYAQVFAGGWYWQDGCGELVLVGTSSPRTPANEGRLPLVWWREEADLVGDDPDASLTCPFDERRVALVMREQVGLVDWRTPEIASGPRAAHVGVCPGERPMICTGVSPVPDPAPIGPQVPPSFALTEPADGAEVEASALTRVLVELSPADTPVGTLCVHDLTRPGGQCATFNEAGPATLDLPPDWLEPGRAYRISATAGVPGWGHFGIGQRLLVPSDAPVPVATFRTAP